MSRLPDFSSRVPRSGPAAGAERAWLAVGGLLLAAALLAGWRAQRDLDRARDQLRSARAAALAASESGRERSAGLAPAELELQTQGRLATLAPPPRILADLAALLPRGVRFERIGLAYGQDVRLELQVVAREAREYDRFLEALEASDRFAEVVPGTENRDGELRCSLGLRYVPEVRP